MAITPGKIVADRHHQPYGFYDPFDYGVSVHYHSGDHSALAWLQAQKLVPTQLDVESSSDSHEDGDRLSYFEGLNMDLLTALTVPELTSEQYQMVNQLGAWMKVIRRFLSVECRSLSLVPGFTRQLFDTFKLVLVNPDAVPAEFKLVDLVNPDNYDEKIYGHALRDSLIAQLAAQAPFLNNLIKSFSDISKNIASLDIAVGGLARQKVLDSFVEFSEANMSMARGDQLLHTQAVLRDTQSFDDAEPELAPPSYDSARGILEGGVGLDGECVLMMLLRCFKGVFSRPSSFSQVGKVAQDKVDVVLTRAKSKLFHDKSLLGGFDQCHFEQTSVGSYFVSGMVFSQSVRFVMDESNRCMATMAESLSDFKAVMVDEPTKLFFQPQLEESELYVRWSSGHLKWLLLQS